MADTETKKLPDPAKSSGANAMATKADQSKQSNKNKQASMEAIHRRLMGQSLCK